MLEQRIFLFVKVMSKYGYPKIHSNLLNSSQAISEQGLTKIRALLVSNVKAIDRVTLKISALLFYSGDIPILQSKDGLMYNSLR